MTVDQLIKTLQLVPVDMRRSVIVWHDSDTVHMPCVLSLARVDEDGESYFRATLSAEPIFPLNADPPALLVMAHQVVR